MIIQAGKRKSFFFVFLFFNFSSFCQINSGKIIYERKTNLEKKYKEYTSDWMIEFLESNKTKTDLFELNFSDSISNFTPIEKEEEDEDSWATNNNSTYQNFNSNSKISKVVIFGDEIIVKSEIANRTWKITDSKRMIGIYECRKAFVGMEDSSKIYAWFSNEILPSVGPEGFCGLPGAILGLATEDGGVVYFAKSVILSEVKEGSLHVKFKDKGILTRAEFEEKLNQLLGDIKEDIIYRANLTRWM